MKQPIAQHAITILINISSDLEVLQCLAEDDAFVECLLSRISVRLYPISSVSVSTIVSLTLRSQ